MDDRNFDHEITSILVDAEEEARRTEINDAAYEIERFERINDVLDAADEMGIPLPTKVREILNSRSEYENAIADPTSVDVHTFALISRVLHISEWAYLYSENMDHEYLINMVVDLYKDGDLDGNEFEERWLEVARRFVGHLPIDVATTRRGRLSLVATLTGMKKDKDDFFCREVEFRAGLEQYLEDILECHDDIKDIARLLMDFSRAKSEGDETGQVLFRTPLVEYLDRVGVKGGDIIMLLASVSAGYILRVVLSQKQEDQEL